MRSVWSSDGFFQVSIFHAHGEDTSGMENESRYFETVGEVGGPRIEHVSDKAIGSVVSDKVFNLGLKESHADKY